MGGVSTSEKSEPRKRGDGASIARERLLATASELFYREGIHAVGVDRIVTEAGVTRATFYRHFPGKGDLVEAYLGVEDANIRGAFAAAAGRAVAAGFQALGDDTIGPARLQP